MADRVLVTGISGFLGGHTALNLNKAGYMVRGSVRSLAKADKVRETLTGHGADPDRFEFVALDLEKDEGWDEAMAGVKYLAHVASPFVTSMPDDKMELIRPAVEGTERALNAALKSDVERIVLTSSMAAVMYGHKYNRPEPFTAGDWTKLDGRNVTAYIESKTLAEQRAWEIMKQAGRENDLAVINPAGIFGPLLDEDPGTSGMIILRMLNGDFPAAPKIFLGTIDVRDVAEAHRLALENPESGGHRFPMSEATLSIKQIGELLAKTFPQYASRMPKFTAPNWLIRIIALFDAEIRSNMGEIGNRRLIDPGDVERLLGRKLIDANEAIVSMGQTLIDQKLVKA